MLKNGIKMIEILTDPDESDVNSDWQEENSTSTLFFIFFAATAVQ